MDEIKKKPNTISMSPGAWKKAEELAKTELRSVSNYIESLVTKAHQKTNK